MTVHLPLVSIVVPSYNYAATLPECIAALEEQSYPRTEIIVVDDRSTDDSFAVARATGVRVLRNAVNGGVASARNHGARHARGEILFFVDADVVLAPDAIENAVTLLEGTPGAVSVCGLYEPEPLVRHSLCEEYRSLQAYVWRMASLGEVSAGFFSLGAIRREAFDATGPFDTGLRQTEEIDYGERLRRHGRILLSDLVRGRHDDDHALVPMLRKLFRRSRDRVPFYLARRRPMQGFELPRRLAATALAPFVPLALAAAALAPSALALGALAWIAMLVLERDLYATAWRRLGAVKTIGLLPWYLLFHLAAGAGVICGLALASVSGPFRRLYGSWDAPASTR